MKKIILSAIVVAGLTGNSFADSNSTIDNNRTVKGTTIGKYQKPGAPIDIRYQSKRVKLNEPSDVNISFTTPLKSGEMEVNINIDKDLKSIGEVYNEITYSLNPHQKEYNLDLRVTSSKNGLYYIRLLTKVNGKSGVKTRAFAVPIYIGSGKLQKKSHQVVMKASGGENLSISKAEESVEVIK